MGLSVNSGWDFNLFWFEIILVRAVLLRADITYTLGVRFRFYRFVFVSLCDVGVGVGVGGGGHGPGPPVQLLVLAPQLQLLRGPVRHGRVERVRLAMRRRSRIRRTGARSIQHTE